MMCLSNDVHSIPILLPRPQILDLVLTTFPRLINVPDNSGSTPLHLAARKGDEMFIKTLMVGIIIVQCTVYCSCQS